MTDEIVLWFAARPESVRVARRRVRSLGLLSGDGSDRLALVCSELVTRAIEAGPHSSQRTIEVRLERRAGSARVTVQRMSEPTQDPDEPEFAEAVLGGAAPAWEVTESGGWAVVEDAAR